MSEEAWFKDKVILVGGGRSTVSVSAVLRYAKLGANRVALVGRNTAKGEEVVDRIARMTGTLTPVFVAADLSRAEDADRVAETVWDRWGAIDVLINATTGTIGPRLFHDLATVDVQEAVGSVLLPPLLTTRAVLPYMQRQGSGAIVSIASDAGKFPTVGETAIGAGMAGIIMFTRALAMEAKRNGIRINAVTPSLVLETEGYERILADPFMTRLFDKAAKMANLGVAVPDDLAALIVFLTGPESQRLTGQAISVNGGISAL